MAREQRGFTKKSKARAKNQASRTKKVANLRKGTKSMKKAEKAVKKAVKLIVKIKKLYKGYQSMDKISKKTMKQMLVIAANMKSFRPVTKFWGDFHRKFVSKRMHQVFLKQFAQSRFPNDSQDSIDEERNPKIAQHKKQIAKKSKKAGMGGSGLSKLIPVKKILTPIKKRLKLIKKLKKKMKIALGMRK